MMTFPVPATTVGHDTMEMDDVDAPRPPTTFKVLPDADTADAALN
jgi:hypothetical protein